MPGDDLTDLRSLLEDYQREISRGSLEQVGIDITTLAPGVALLTEVESLLVPPSRLYVVDGPEGLVATGGLRDLGDGVGEIKRMFVAPAARRRGIARDLLARLVADAQHAGFLELRLETAPWLAGAIALYRRMGFEDRSEYAGREFGEIEEIVGIPRCMSLRLPGRDRAIVDWGVND